jgi:hypothetical protein
VAQEVDLGRRQPDFFAAIATPPAREVDVDVPESDHRRSARIDPGEHSSRAAAVTVRGTKSSA